MIDANILLSIVIPAYNEEPNISSTLRDIAEYLKTQKYGYEIIVVDDGSKDRTAEIASALAPLFNSFILLKNPLNRGKGYSVKRGVLSAKGEFVLFMDADNSTRINQLEKLIQPLKNGCDVAIASRRIAGAQINNLQPFYRIILGNIYIILSRIILGARVRDYNCGFKLYTKKAAGKLFPLLTRNDWSFDSELIFLVTKFKLKLKEIPVTWEDKGTSKVKPLSDGIKSLLSLFKIKLLSIKGFYDTKI